MAKNLVGPGGLLSDLTKQVLETGLAVEMEEHLGYPRRAPHRQRQDLGQTGVRGRACVDLGVVAELPARVARGQPTFKP